MKHKKQPAKPVVKCDECKFKTTMIQTKMHMKAVHGTSRPKRASKRLLPNFTPEIKPSKRSKKVKPLNMDTMINSEVSIEDDNSILLVDDTFSGKSMALE